MENLKLYYIAGVYGIPAQNIRYKDLGLYTEMIYTTEGLLDYINFYEEYDGVAYTNLILKEEYTYTLSGGLYTNLLIDISFYDVDDNVGHTFQKNKNLNIEESFEVGIQRREYILKKAMREVYFTVGEANAILLLDPISLEIFKYRINIKQELMDDITASVDPLWLTPSYSDNLVTLKVKVVEILNV